jgi:transcriptional regulator with XRE-family HTH domain
VLWWQHNCCSRVDIPKNVGAEALNQSQQEFCTALKAARERRGLKLTDIADATKVCPSYFSALERNDLRVWPKGIFRRSFSRAYAGTVGLPVEPMLEEFMRLFPEEEAAAAPPPPAAVESAWQRLVQAFHNLFGSPSRPWVSDASRAEPRKPAPKLRIRIKVTP